MMKIQIIKSNRKTVALQMRLDGTVVVRAPYRISEKEVEQILDEKKSWIEKNIKRMEEQRDRLKCFPRFTKEEIANLADQALQYIPERVKYYAPIVGVDYKRITIRNQKTRWGSCSSKGGLNFNCLLMLTPPEVIDYVVVHELCHRKEMNHSKAFWVEVEKVLPDYQSAKKWLKEYGDDMMYTIFKGK